MGLALFVGKRLLLWIEMRLFTPIQDRFEVDFNRDGVTRTLGDRNEDPSGVGTMECSDHRRTERSDRTAEHHP